MFDYITTCMFDELKIKNRQIHKFIERCNLWFSVCNSFLFLLSYLTKTNKTLKHYIYTSDPLELDNLKGQVNIQVGGKNTIMVANDVEETKPLVEV